MTFRVLLVLQSNCSGHDDRHWSSTKERRDWTTALHACPRAALSSARELEMAQESTLHSSSSTPQRRRSMEEEEEGRRRGWNIGAAARGEEM